MQSQVRFPWIRFEAYFSYPLARFVCGLCIRSPVSGTFPVQLMVSWT